MKLPTFEECQDAEADMKLNTLQKFILDNEPVGNEGLHFRNQLREALDFSIEKYIREIKERASNSDSCI